MLNRNRCNDRVELQKKKENYFHLCELLLTFNSNEFENLTYLFSFPKIYNNFNYVNVRFLHGELFKILE